MDSGGATFAEATDPSRALKRFVDRLYQRFVQRSPTEAEQAAAARRTLAETADALVRSAEYLALEPAAVLAGSAVAQAIHPMGTATPDESAIVGSNGWMFIYRGSNNVLGQFRGEQPLSRHDLAGWERVLSRQTEHAAKLRARLVHVAAPDKLALIPEMYPEPIEPVGPRPVEQLREALPGLISYPVEALRAAPGEPTTKTDSHISLSAAALICRELLDRLGLSSPRWLHDPPAREVLRSAGLGKKYRPPIYEIEHQPIAARHIEVVSSNADELLQVGAHMGITHVSRNPAADFDATLVIFGDSYCYPDKGTIGQLLQRLFREVHFLWAPLRWDPDYLRAVRPDFIVGEIAERNLVRVPPRGIAIADAAAEALQRGRLRGGRRAS